MISIDGSQGEGGGQILRTSLALSLITGESIRIDHIRAGRKKSGLLNQHLTALNAAATIASADVVGAQLGSRSLEFRPNGVKPGTYRFAVGTAGSATLVLQTILPPLLIAAEPSFITLEGGTHNPAAPPFDFLQRCFAPAIERMGPRLELELYRPGFFPAGGGNFRAQINPVKQMAPIELSHCGEVQDWRARAIISRLSPEIGERELAIVQKELGWSAEQCRIESVDSLGPGNAVLVELDAENVTAIFTAFGQRGRSAEDVARDAASAAKAWLAADVPVDEHLADQLLLPMALAGGGTFRTTKPSPHTITNADVIARFLPVRVAFAEDGGSAWRVTIQSR